MQHRLHSVLPYIGINLSIVKVLSHIQLQVERCSLLGNTVCLASLRDSLPQVLRQLRQEAIHPL